MRFNNPTPIVFALLIAGSFWLVSASGVTSASISQRTRESICHLGVDESLSTRFNGRISSLATDPIWANQEPSLKWTFDISPENNSGSITPTPTGAIIDNQVQRVRAEIDGTGLAIDGGRLVVKAWGRTEGGCLPSDVGRVRLCSDRVVIEHAGMHQVISTSAQGIRHDIVIEDRPDGPGNLLVEVGCKNGYFESKNECGSTLVIGNRRVTYDRLKVVDAAGRELVARMDVVSGNARIYVDDANAQYPVLIDPTISETGQLATGRYSHTATLLTSGKVLVTGGNGLLGLMSSCEIYDPHTGNWTSTGSMGIERVNHTATSLSSGKVLVAGGRVNGVAGNGFAASCELYDSSLGRWTATAPMGTARAGHTAILLSSGLVLVAGGGTNSCEIYDPGTGVWSATGSLMTSRSTHTATLLSNGKVLVAGGASGLTALQSCEIYDPETGVWSATGALASARQSQTASLLVSGLVLVTGGSTSRDPDPPYNSAPLHSCEIYNPSSGLWSPANSLLEARMFHTATRLPSGEVLVISGGIGNSEGSLTSCELFDPNSGGWSNAGTLLNSRVAHSATLLSSGQVLVVGGGDGGMVGAFYKSCELYGQSTSTAYTVTYDPNGATAGTVPGTQMKESGINLVVSANDGNLIKTGGIFSGWNTAADGSGTAYATGATYNVDSSVTLFAQWIPQTYTVIYNANGATGGVVPDSQNKTYGVDLVLATNSGNLLKTGSIFMGWNSAPDSSGTFYAVGSTYSGESSITLYAVWITAGGNTGGNSGGGGGGGGCGLGSIVALLALFGVIALKPLGCKS